MQTRVGVSVTGDATKVLATLTKRLESNAEKAVKAAAEVIYVASQEYVPVLTGTLKRSGEVLHTPSGLKSEAGVGYGLDPNKKEDHPSGPGGAVREHRPYLYAVKIHELMVAGPVEAKRNDYLQRAVENTMEEAGNVVLVNMRR